MNSILVLTYIFALIFPFSFSYAKDNRTRIINLLQSRCNAKTYYISNLICCFIGAFIIFFIPFIIEIIINSIICPKYGGALYSFNYTTEITGDNVLRESVNAGLPFKWLYIHHPQGYNILFSFIFAAFSGILSMFIFSLSLILKKLNILLLLPLYVITFLQNKIAIVIDTHAKKYLNIIMSDYITIDSFHGKSLLYFVALIFSFLIIAIVITYIKASKDQI